jgi:DNA-binding winged helix-turn-helix (wHTH) protein
MKRTVVVLLALALARAALASDSPQQAFARAWEGRIVTVRATLYSLIYNERGKLGTTRSGLREGLIVVTPSQGAYFQFDSRQGRNEVRQHDLQQVIAAVNAAYEKDALDVRPYRKLDAVGINRYDPGVELVVSAVRFARDEVQFEFAATVGGEAVTAMRVKWPVPWSKGFSERGLVEGLLQRFVDVKPL